MVDPTRVVPLTDFDGNGAISASEFGFWQGQLQSTYTQIKRYEPGGSRAGQYSFTYDYNRDGATNLDDFSARFGGTFQEVTSAVQRRVSSGDLTLVTTTPGSSSPSSRIDDLIGGYSSALVTIGSVLLVIFVGWSALTMMRRLLR